MSQAATVVPKLTEGDQVLFINGTTVADKNHEQVVMLIRETRDLRPRELKLVVKPASKESHTIKNQLRIRNTRSHSLENSQLGSESQNVDGNTERGKIITIFVRFLFTYLSRLLALALSILSLR